METPINASIYAVAGEVIARPGVCMDTLEAGARCLKPRFAYPRNLDGRLRGPGGAPPPEVCFSPNKISTRPATQVMNEKQNYWQFMNCGREPGGLNIDELGICPASVDVRYDGINDGDYAGRFCWYVSGTMCNGEVQGTFAKKIGDCLECPFFLEVGKQEDLGIVFTIEDAVQLDRGKP